MEATLFLALAPVLLYGAYKFKAVGGSSIPFAAIMVGTIIAFFISIGQLADGMESLLGERS